MTIKATTTGFNPGYSDDAPERADIDAMSGPALLEFGATWCGYCLAARGNIEKAMADHPALPHIKIYDGKGRPLGRSYRIKLWPTLVLLNNGEEVERLVRPGSVQEIAAALTRLTTARSR